MISLKIKILLLNLMHSITLPENKSKFNAYDALFPNILNCLKRLDEKGKLTLLALISPLFHVKDAQTNLIKVDGFFDYLVDLLSCESSELKDFVLLILIGFVNGNLENSLDNLSILIKNDNLIDSLFGLLRSETCDSICEQSLVILAFLSQKDVAINKISEFDNLYSVLNDLILRNNVEIKINIVKILAWLSKQHQKC